MPEQIRNSCHNDVWPKQESGTYVQSSLVMEQMLPPLVRNDLGNNDSHKIGFAALYQFLHMVHDRFDNRAVGRRNHNQIDTDVPRFPFSRKSSSRAFVD